MENYPTVNLSLTVNNAAVALEFYTQAFGAKEDYHMDGPDGSIVHCEFTIGNTRIMMSGGDPQWHAVAMPEGAMSSCLFNIVCEDCDSAYDQAVAAGAKTLNPPTDYFWGVRSAMVLDPFGYRWSLGQQTEQLTSEEIAQRAKELFGG